MSLFERAEFDAFVTELAGVTLVDQWESRVAKVGDKVFAVLNDDGTKIAFKVSEESFEILTALGGIGQAPYFAKRKWVAASPTSMLSDDELRHYLGRSYELVAAGLTKKLRMELGVTV